MMIDEETKRKLRELGLSEMVEALDIQIKDPSYLTFSFAERIRMITDYTYEAKYAASVERLTKRARLRYPQADMTQVLYEARGIDRVQIQELGTCQFLQQSKNIIIDGCCGTGKTYLSCAIGRQACRKKMRVRYIRVPDLLMERDELAAIERSDQKILKKYASYDLLVLDEWLVNKMNDTERQFLFELIERRYGIVSTVFCSQYGSGDWHARLGGGIQADAIMDRIVHGSIKVNLGEMNMREATLKQ